jgi:thioredoxin-like negative regulator of GroEL
MDSQQPEAERLRRDIEWALGRALDPREVLPMLHRLVRTAREGSEESTFAHRNLAELLIERDPWRAALHARKVLASHPGDDRGWAMVGLCQTLLGHYRYAVTAYKQAITSAPNNPWYAHNLGHLLDVALGRANEALVWLQTAYESAPWSGEIAASYAHALARVGEIPEAKKVLTLAMKKGASREHSALMRWLEAGAPADGDQPTPRPAPLQPRFTAAEDEMVRRPKRTANAKQAAELEEVLTRGLTSLPLDARQRTRAKELARDALGRLGMGPRGAASTSAIAAAIAYAIVYVDHIPLTQAEVAACFRVGVASLRGRFGELRTRLDLTPGDTRYATPRRR